MVVNIRGYDVLIDDEDYDFVNNKIWYTMISRNNKDQPYFRLYSYDKHKVKLTLLHRLIVGIADHDKKVVDHINGNTLDNRKCNLRICSQAENSRNAKIGKNNTSGYKGVYWDKFNNKWVAQIKINYKHKNLGRYLEKEDAYKAYCEAAIKYHGEFARVK